NRDFGSCGAGRSTLSLSEAARSGGVPQLSRRRPTVLFRRSLGGVSLLSLAEESATPSLERGDPVMADDLDTSIGALGRQDCARGLERALAEPDVAGVLRKLRATHHLAVVAGPCADNLAVRTFPRHCNLNPKPDTRNPKPETQSQKPPKLHPTPYTIHNTPYILHPTPYTLHHTAYTIHHTPCTLHPSPFTLHPKP
ncbi:hypothetical protein T484DRAFT_3645055, partial [Baffinella frigidus]